MEVHHVDLTISAVAEEQYPKTDYPEIALVGRSNVGKSSLTNVLINRKNFAHTSSQPGKTQTLNFYNVEDQLFFVDVPGYGYSKLSKENDKKIGLMIEEYLKKRETLSHVFMLINYRHKPTEDDVLMYNYLKYYNIPVTIIATKTDKVSRNSYDKNIKIIKETLNLIDTDDLILFSAISKTGKIDVHDKILKIIDNGTN